ncbi:dynamin family protein [Candidatus Sulfurimonas marisnigri]|uniref:Dynamin family protein n=1 Tax=Candidatus Sulfurimonas marisnigri TaxID=2740405 RepID=A0A7S7M1E3_9BACT|nr:dynamin family protein [Candidatus Sulfurimonas marisnigri]QOY55269.1 dynamin family protein [Candidatus Sulfurimonas marisnigri]
MKHLEAIVKEYKEQFLQEELFDESISGEIKRIQKALLNEKFLPSIQLKNLFNKLLRRSKYPMEVAIAGQFSSGKSTFLNALLSKDILPTGITPVTSKVNFINYGEEYKLKVSYNNGANEYHALETIAQFTDQRKAVEDIKYLTLYVPMDILKDITFVDTPGLNSQSLSDTQVTKKILRDVDGIIWLTLLDNAGKESEAEVLQEYLENFKDKSLCVLNQKDKFTPEQVETTLSYIKENFSTFFSEVIPISAKQALDSRVNQKAVLIDTALYSLQKAFKESSSINRDEKDITFFHDDFAKFSKEIESIKKQDNSNNKRLMESSNISEVLNFIENTIRPQAKASKAYAIKKDLSSICDILIKEYETILSVYESLVEILVKKESEILEAFDSVYAKHSKSLILTSGQIESILQSVADTIYQNITTKNASYYTQKKSLLRQNVIKTHTYETLHVDSEAIMQKLFYENQSLDKQVKATMAHLKNIQLQSSEDFRDVFRILKHAVQSWQEPYELIKKNREIASDLEFANTRQFVAKVYENIILSYHRAILGNIRALHKKFAFFNGALSYSYHQVTEDSIFAVKEMIDKQVEIFEKNPTKHTLNIPSSDDILEVVKKNFGFEKIELFLTSRRNYLFKTVKTSKTQFSQINSEQINYVISKKRVFMDKIEDIKEIQNSF